MMKIMISKEKKAEYNKQYREKNKEKTKAYEKLWGARNKELLTERSNESKREWRAKNPHKIAEYTADYRAKKLTATPIWAKKQYIELWYKLAKIEERRIGRKVHVDHIVPLKGKSVCGLHCEDNMQLLTDSLNSKKHNSFWPDMRQEDFYKTGE